MKTRLLYLVVAIGITAFSASAQQTSNLEVFSENGETFTVSVNGIAQNDKPQTNVKVTGLSGEFHRVSVRFSDASLGLLNQNIALEPGKEQRAVVMMNKKGAYVLRPFGEPTAIVEDRPSPATKPTLQAAPEVVQAAQAPAERTVQATPTKVTTTTTTTTTAVPTPGTTKETFTMDMGVGEQRMAIKIDINDPLMDGGSASTTTKVHTTETIVVTQEEAYAPSRTRAQPAPAPEPVAPAQAVVKCGPMDSGTFAGVTKSISAKSFAEEKHTTARQVLRSNCMSADQIKEVMGLFSFEDDKLTFAKAAYDRCSDPENYWKVNDAFTFSASISDLDEFLQTK